MSFKKNGSDITSNWSTYGATQTGTTGFKENGTDLARKYTKCGSANCHVTQAPVCESIPSGFDPNQSYTFWTGMCSGGGGGGDPVE